MAEEREGISKQKARPVKNPGKLWRAVFLTLLVYAAATSMIVLVVMLVVTREKIYAWGFLGALGAWLLFLLIRYGASRECRCPLCHGPWLSRRDCRMHDKARRHLFFGYWFSMVIDIVFTWQFRCPYCGTPFRMRR